MIPTIATTMDNQTERNEYGAYFAPLRTKSLRTSSNLLILQLAIFDFIMMAKAPIFIYNSAMKGFAAGDIGCQIFALMGAYSGIGASMTNACIAFDRTKSLRTSSNLLILQLAIFDFIMMAKAPIFIYNSAMKGFAAGDIGCQIFALMGAYSGIGASMTNACIAFDREQAKKMNVESLRSNQQANAQSAEIRIAKAALTVCFLFVASWTPYGIMSLIGAFGDQQLLTPGLDEVEYALPASDAPTLAEVLSADDEGEEKIPFKPVEEPTSCSAVQVDFLQAVSQQIIQAQERSSAGAATALIVGSNGKTTVGTAHGHILSFHDQTLRWVCDSNTDCGAVSCLAYNQDSTRLLTGYARGLICQYDSIRGLVLRRVTLGGEIWGTLRVTWAGMSGLALDTGGSVWLIKFSRPLGVRSARSSCLFSGARGEVVAMAARDARVLALATLSRVIIVAGGRAAGVRLGGPPDTLPVLAWSDTDDRILVCGRAKTLQWLAVSVTGSSILLRPVHRVELKSSPLWLGWLGENLAIFDADENLRLWGDDYEKPLDLSHIEPVYASAFFKGLWTDGRVSRAMCMAGGSALGGACVAEGALSLLGRRGVVRVRPRDLLARAQASMSSGRHTQALRLLCSAQGSDAKALANSFIINISERPHLLSNKALADLAINDELWTCLWEQCAGEKIFVEALGEAAVRGELYEAAPSPDCSQELIERLASVDPSLVERVVASLPLTGAMRELVLYVDEACRGGAECACAGSALLLAAADALAGRGAAGRPLPPHAQPSARHDALHALLAPAVRGGRWRWGEWGGGGGARSPLLALAAHDARACVRLLEQSAREPPFAGPLGKQNRLRVARALLHLAPSLQLSAGALPGDRELLASAQQLAAATPGERADRAWLALLLRAPATPAVSLAPASPAVPLAPAPAPAPAPPPRRATASPRTATPPPPPRARACSGDSTIEADGSGARKQFEGHLAALVELRPSATAALVDDQLAEQVAALLRHSDSRRAHEFAECLLEAGKLRGEAATAFFRNLCISRPTDASDFLEKNPGVLRPEEALAIVRETGARDAEPACLEATGDPEAALDALLALTAAAAPEAAARLVRRACELCARVAPGVPAEAAAGMWARLLRRADAPPAALLLEAAAYLPSAQLAERVCGAPRVALGVLGAARGRRGAWACAARVAAREAHEALARALRAARRGLPVRGRCARCDAALAASGSACRTTHCARAVHAECGAGAACALCGARLPDAVLALPPLAPRPPHAAPQDHVLQLLHDLLVNLLKMEASNNTDAVNLGVGEVEAEIGEELKQLEEGKDYDTRSEVSSSTSSDSSTPSISSASSKSRRKIFMPPRSRLSSGSYKRRSPSPYMRERLPVWFTRGRDSYSSSSSAAAEAYVAEYMRSMHHQLPPLPYVPPPGFSGALAAYDGLPPPPPPPPPRYYDGPLADYPRSVGAMRELVLYVDEACRGGAECACAGSALLLAAADALAGRGAAGRPLPPHAQPSARHDALHARRAVAVGEWGGGGGARSPLLALAAHDARACVRLLEQSAREPPFAGPLGKQNRLRVARALLHLAPSLQCWRPARGPRAAGQRPAAGRRHARGARRPRLARATAARARHARRLARPRRPPSRSRPPLRPPPPPPPAPRDRLAAHRDAAAAATRPRVLWRLDVLLDNHNEALAQFFQIENPSDADIDELFEYLRSRIEADGSGARKQFEGHLAALVELRPSATAALVDDQLAEQVAALLRHSDSRRAHEFAECLLEAGKLRGEAATAFFRNLCISRPTDASDFLEKNPGVLRPEEALAIVRETGARDAEPACLEATGDPEAALDALLALTAAAAPEAAARLVRRACELCARVAPGVPAEAAAGMWARLLRRADAPPAALLLEAAAYLPSAQLAERVCGAPRVALGVLGAARGRRGAWACAARVAAREAHEALARALRAARRGLPVRGRCARCDAALAASGSACRTTHCARAVHAECGAGAACALCGARLPDAVLALPPLAPRPPHAAPQDHVLQLLHDLLVNLLKMEASNNTDAVNLGVGEVEAEIGEELKQLEEGKDYDTRSEVSMIPARPVSAPPVLSQKERRTNRKRTKSESRSPIQTKRARVTTTTNKTKTYDYMTKLNYLFRDTRFFLIKSNNAENITLSKAKGVWSTLPQNEANLNQAYRESRNVLLIFSVKESGKFAGFARLSSESRRDVPPISWVLPPGLSAKVLDGVFKVDWICRKELPFSSTLHLYNPWNEGKPVKIGRDGQEIEPKVAEELCRLFPEDEGIEMTPILRKSKEASKKAYLKSGGNYRTYRAPLLTRGSNFRSRLNTSSRSRRKIFMPPRSRLSSGSYKRRSPSPYMRERLPVWFTRGRDSYSSSSSAAAEAYVAEYMRSMHHQLPPLPYVPPPGFSGALAAYDGLPPPPPPPPPRYYDGPLADYPRSVLVYDKRSYERSVDEFLWRTSDRSRGRSRDRESHRSYRDRRLWFIASRVAMQARKVMTLAALSALLWAASAAAAERGGGIKVGSGAAGGARGEGARGGGVRVGGEGCGARAPPPRRPRPARPLPSPPRSSCRTRPSAHGTTPKPRRQRSPTILDSLCKEFLAVNVSAILYLMNHEQYGRSTASAQYFLQLAGYLGIPDRFKFTILNAVVVKKPADLNELVTSEARVMLLYATREEAADILSTAGDLHLTSENFVWIVTQTTAVKVFAYGVDSYVSEPENALHPLGTRLSCSGAGAGEARWATGERFYRHLRNVSVDSEAGRPSIEFTPDGELRAAELKIMNLRPAIGEQLVWEEIGTWNSYPKERLDIKDIVWPGGLHTPPQGVPEKFHMRITFLEEPPYINLAPPDPISGRCSLDRGVICRVAPEVDVAGLEAGTAHRNSSLYQCCSGFCIDLLQQLAEQLGFTYELSRVEDGRWGTLHNSKWNGLIADLVNKRTDMVLTSLIINSDREAVVDFSVPFMETGVAIVVAKRTGIISPTAFLEPFDTASWMLVGAVAIQAATFSIFFFEWLSPSGYNRSTVSAGVSGVLTAELDAFIYDGTVLDYLVSQRLLDLRSNGDLERLRRYWMTGTCKPNKQEHKSSDPLALEQFLSAFLLLMAGILLAALLLLLEHVYFRYMRAHLAASTVGPCCALVSLSMGERRTGEFPPNTSLFELANTLAPAELSSLTHPTILYMRQEVTGELALRNKTLRQLGLIGGRAVLRLLNKAEEGMQANVSAVYRRPLPAKDDKFLESHKEREHTYKETPSSGAPEKQQVQKKVHTETFDPIDLIKKEKGKKTQVKHEEEKTVQIRDSDDNLPTKEDVSMEVDNFEANVKSASSSTSCLSQENLERRLKIEEEVTFLGAQKAIAFIPEGSDEEMEDLPDTFYELTVEETSQMRLSAHKHVVVRVQFPDHIILQVTTPLKETLDPKITLLEAKFVPCVHMHFKWIQEEANAKYLKEEIYSKTTSSDAASERRTGEFPPNTSLFELANTLAPAELSSLTHPTILYMRQEVTGELALRDKTLRQLGLIGGRAVLRLLNKAEEGMQANVSAVYRRPLPAKDDKVLESHKEREPTHTYKETPSSGAPEKQQVQKKVHTETFDPIDLIKKEKGKKTQVKHEEEKTVQIRDSDDNLPTKEDVSMEVDNFEANVKSASSSTSCLSQENLERRLKIEEEVTFLGAQKAIAFMPEGSDEEMEDLPDTFYELTVEETSQMRLSAHKHVVVRVQFPDHIILQGIFSPDDTIEVVINFIKAHLQTPDKPFHIFTTPLKETLDPKITLLEAKFVPCVHMHFKWIQEEANAKYLKEEIYSKTTSSDAAKLPNHLTSITCFGDNIEDEWFIIFIHQGSIHIIPPSLQDSNSTITIGDAITIIAKLSEKTKVSHEIQQSILQRIGKYPEKIEDSFHRTTAILPVDIATLLTLKPTLIAPLVSSYCNHDVIDARACKNVAFEDCVQVNVKFTKCLYAMLMHAKPLKNIKFRDIDDKKSIIGQKLTIGYQILMNKPTQDIFSTKQFKNFIGKLSASGYFKNNIEGSADYMELLKNAKEFYSVMECPINAQVSNEISHLMLSCEFTQSKEALLQKCTSNDELVEDKEDWLNINPDQLNDLLNARYKKKATFNTDDVLTANNVTSKLSSFLIQTSDFEGIETEANNNLTSNIEFDPDDFSNSVQKMLDLITLGDTDNKEASDSDDYYESGDNDEDDELNDIKQEQLQDSKTILQNIVQSMKEEGLSGPTSNLMNTAGFNKRDFLDSDDDDE
ncbi:hypothetical protein MSG28_005153 [Choristoneura fumiferana]|uniref:Uncharacterized protein n=1 Tax=Choristoneura fumiferana TaxID=7141 RepID=A0ACC0JQ57_CHOFU|nr:hypothetical protein MSG28_005153 [Choristoneura fumiferana]